MVNLLRRDTCTDNHLYGSAYSLAARSDLSDYEMEVDCGRAALLADDHEGSAFGRTDGDRRRVVEEVLVSTQPSFGVVG
jgi:hypothetical protein